MNILVTGSRGMLGTDLVQILSEDHEVMGWDLHNCNILELDQVDHLMAAYQPDVVIHAAAYTNVDLAESEPEAAMRLNATGTRHIAIAAQKCEATVVYISTDYVFDGTASRPYQEDDAPCPAGVYGKTKLQGERVIQELLAPQKYLIARIAWLYGKHGKNFVSTMLQLVQTQDTLRVVHDQIGSPTYTKDVARNIAALLEHKASGVFHVTNSGQCTWYEFARAIFEAARVQNIVLEPISTEELGRPAPRPAFSVLNTSKFTRTTGKQIRHWQEGLQEYLKEIDIL
jgi:dTDP-4-dehydrorhamnose reductase